MKKELLKLSVLALMVGVASCQEEAWNDGNKLSEDQPTEIQRESWLTTNYDFRFKLDIHEETYTMDTVFDISTPHRAKIVVQKTLRQVNDQPTRRVGLDVDRYSETDDKYILAIWYSKSYQSDVQILKSVGFVENVNFTTQLSQGLAYFYITIYKVSNDTETKSAYVEPYPVFNIDGTVQPLDPPLKVKPTCEQYHHTTRTFTLIERVKL